MRLVFLRGRWRAVDPRAGRRALVDLSALEAQALGLPPWAPEAASYDVGERAGAAANAEPSAPHAPFALEASEPGAASPRRRRSRRATQGMAAVGALSGLLGALGAWRRG